MGLKNMNTSFLYGVVLTILLALGVVMFLCSSAFSIQQVEMKGLSTVSEQEIRKLADNVVGQNIFIFDEESLKAKIELHPLIEGVTFKRKLPHTLVLNVTERVPFADVVVPKGVIEVDREGVFLRRLESWPPKDYPVISGIEVADTAGPGQTIANPSLTAALNLLKQAPDQLLPSIGELSVNNVQQITLFLTSGVEVRLGQANDWKEKLNALYQLITDKEYQAFQQGVRYIDFTAAKPVIGR